MAYNKETGLYEGYIYKVTNNINGKLYIGQTRWNISDRWAGHKHDAMRRNYNTAFAKAIRKYGAENFKVEVVEKIKENDLDLLNNKLNEREIFYIKQFHSLSHENGYNITKGGNNIGDAYKVKTYCFLKDGTFVGEFESRAEAGRFIGVKGEDITGAILRKGLCRNYYFTSSPKFDYVSIKHPMTERKIKSYDYYGNLICCYKNCYEAAKKINGSPQSIYTSCFGKTGGYYGCIWRFEEDSFDTYKVPHKGIRMVNQYTINDVFIKTYGSIKEAGETLGIKRPNISAVLSKDYKSCKTAGGYQWFYADDPNQPDKSKIIQNIKL